MSENVQDKDRENAPTEGDSDDGGESPVMIEEAESTQASTESGQGSSHSPDSTMAEGGAQAQSSTGTCVDGDMAKANPLLVKVLKGQSITLPPFDSIRSGEASCSSTQEVPDSPSRRKRESDAPAPEPPFSPTKKLKSPKKDDDKSPPKGDKK